MIHIVTGDSAATALKHAFRGSNHQIYTLPLNFSVGPINAIHEEEGIHRHFEWLDSSFNFRNDQFAQQEETYRQSLDKVRYLKNGEQVNIWACENAAEQIGLRLVCYLIAGKKVELSMVNTAEAMDEFMKDSDIQIEIRHSGECTGKQLSHFYKHSRTWMPETMAAALAGEAERLLSGTSLLRSWKQGEVQDNVETRDDEFILECVREQQTEDSNDGFVKAVCVVGQVFGESYHIYSDSWIDYRIRSLIHSGQLISRGDLGSIRSYEVRTSEIE